MSSYPYDYSTEVPPGVKEAARIVANHAALRGWGEGWRVMGLADRAAFERLEAENAALKQRCDDLLSKFHTAMYFADTFEKMSTKYKQQAEEMRKEAGI